MVTETTWMRGPYRLAVKARPTFDEGQHPRDREGKFIEKGGKVRHFITGVLGTVLDNLGGGDVLVRRDDNGQTVKWNRNAVNAVQNADGSKPTSNTADAPSALPPTPDTPDARGAVDETVGKLDVPEQHYADVTDSVQGLAAALRDADDENLTEEVLTAGDAYRAALSNGTPNDEADERTALLSVLDDVRANHADNPDVQEWATAMQAAATAPIPSTDRPADAPDPSSTPDAPAAPTTDPAAAPDAPPAPDVPASPDARQAPAPTGSTDATAVRTGLPATDAELVDDTARTVFYGDYVDIGEGGTARVKEPAVRGTLVGVETVSGGREWMVRTDTGDVVRRRVKLNEPVRVRHHPTDQQLPPGIFRARETVQGTSIDGETVTAPFDGWAWSFNGPRIRVALPGRQSGLLLPETVHRPGEDPWKQPDAPTAPDAVNPPTPGTAGRFATVEAWREHLRGMVGQERPGDHNRALAAADLPDAQVGLSDGGGVAVYRSGRRPAWTVVATGPAETFGGEIPFKNKDEAVAFANRLESETQGLDLSADDIEPGLSTWRNPAGERLSDVLIRLRADLDESRGLTADKSEFIRLRDARAAEQGGAPAPDGGDVTPPTPDAAAPTPDATVQNPDIPAPDATAGPDTSSVTDAEIAAAGRGLGTPEFLGLVDRGVVTYQDQTTAPDRAGYYVGDRLVTAGDPPSGPGRSLAVTPTGHGRTLSTGMVTNQYDQAPVTLTDEGRRRLGTARDRVVTDAQVQTAQAAALARWEPLTQDQRDDLIRRLAAHRYRRMDERAIRFQSPESIVFLADLLHEPLTTDPSPDGRTPDVPNPDTPPTPDIPAVPQPPAGGDIPDTRVAIDPHPEGTQVARPVLYTYQRKKIVALGLDDDPAADPVVQQAAARVRARKPLSTEQAAALADAVRERAADARPVQRRSADRAANRLDAAAAHAQGRPSPSPDVTGGEVTAVRGDDVAEGDHVAVPSRDGFVTGRVVDARVTQGGRVSEYTVRDANGVERTVTATAPAYLLPDLPDPQPMPAPEGERRMVPFASLNAGDTIVVTNRLGERTEAVVQANTEDQLGDPYIYTTDRQMLRLPSGTLVMRVKAGEGSDPSPAGSFPVPVDPTDPPEVSWLDVRVGDRVAVGSGDEPFITGYVLGKDSEDGANTVRVLGDNGEQIDWMANLGLYRLGEQPAMEAVLADSLRTSTQREIEARIAHTVRGLAANTLNDIMTHTLYPYEKWNQGSDPKTAAIRRVRRMPSGAFGDAYQYDIGTQLARAGGGTYEDHAPTADAFALAVEQHVRNRVVQAIDSAEPVGLETVAMAVQRVLDDMLPPEASDLRPLTRPLLTAIARHDGNLRAEAAVARPAAPSRLDPSVPIADRMAAYRNALGDGTFGHRQMVVAEYSNLDAEALARGEVPEPVVRPMGVKDTAADGMPGEHTMAQLEVVKAAGREVATEVDAEVDRLIDRVLEGTGVPAGVGRDGALRALDARIADLPSRAAVRVEIRSAEQAYRNRVAADHGFASWDDVLKQEQTTPTGTPRYREIERALIDGSEADLDPTVRDLLARDNALRAEQDRLKHAADTIRLRYVDLQREAAMTVLGRIRGIGQARLKTRTASTNTSLDVKAEATLNVAVEVYPDDWVEALNGKFGTIEVGHVDRGFADSRNNIIRLSNRPPAFDGDNGMFGVAYHEIGHFMEEAVPGLMEAQEAYLVQRTVTGDVGDRERPSPKLMADLKPYANYKPNEITYEDEFKEPYSGKWYGGKGYELFTTGVESVFAGSDYTDPDFRHWVLGVMATLGTPTAPSVREPERPAVPETVTTDALKTVFDAFPAEGKPYLRTFFDDQGNPTGSGANGVPMASPEVTKVLTDLFGYDGGEASMRVVPEQVTVWQGSAAMSGVVMAGDGRVGTVQRRIVRDPKDGAVVVEHDELVLDPGVQGTGWASDYYDALFARYREAGVNRVTLVANEDVGGYAWAQRGFGWGSEDAAAVAHDYAAESLFQLSFNGVEQHGLTDAQARRIMEASELLGQAAYALNDGGGGTGYTPKEIANMLSDITWTERTAGGREVKMWPGKRAMLGRSWSAVYEIAPVDAAAAPAAVAVG